MTQSENPGATSGIGVDRAIRKVAAQLMYACSLACFLAALSLVLLMWISAQVGDDLSHDWPTQYWFAVVPLLVVAGTLFGAGFRFESPPPAPRGRA